MPKLTTTDWGNIKNELGRVYGSVRLAADGHLIFAIVRQDKMKLTIAVYVNGKIKGADIQHFKASEMDKLSDVQRKFMRHKFYSPNKKDVKFYEKLKGKKYCKENGVYERSFSTWPYFNTPGAFVAKLKKTCESVEILTAEDYDQRLANIKQAGA